MDVSTDSAGLEAGVLVMISNKLDFLMINKTDWAGLEPGVLDMILNKLDHFSDYFGFSTVCKSWYHMAEQQKQQRLWYREKLPLLMISSPDGSQNQYSFYSVTRRKVLDLKLQIPFNIRCCGSSHGWLCFYQPNLTIVLLNPFTGEQICLPPIKHVNAEFEEVDVYEDLDEEALFEINNSLYQLRIKKVILSANPSVSPNDYMVVAIDDLRSLAYLRSGDDCWKRIHYTDNIGIGISDVIFYDNCILAVGIKGLLVLADLGDNSDFLQLQVVSPWMDTSGIQEWYIVESSKKSLLLIQRILDSNDPDESGNESDDESVYRTKEIKIFAIMKNSDDWSVVETKNLEDDALFLGGNHSNSILSSDYPGCQPNCIYYTVSTIDGALEFPFGYGDIGIFSVEDGKFSSLYILDEKHYKLPSPIWILPTITWNASTN